ncbi:hypothetical protein [Luteolibacter sp. LG18]|uniref:hypothetical protein n=1 Tax=Luteolibacter sp. LG18 TaxID=2819286 RepID=UPI0030C74474
MNQLPKKTATTLSLDRELLAAARREAGERGCSLSALLERWVAEQLLERRTAHIRLEAIPSTTPQS